MESLGTTTLLLKIIGIGPDSLLVAIAYALGVVGLRFLG
jgi:hypothetical protein